MLGSVEDFKEGLVRYYRIPYVYPTKMEHNADWGFTIYRTFYGPGSDDQWIRLLDTIHQGVEQEISTLENARDDIFGAAKIKARFRLHARSDLHLNGCTWEQLSKIYLGECRSIKDGLTYPESRRVFFMADEEVLQNPKLDRLKVVGAKYDPIADIPRHFHVGQKYFGWLRMCTSHVMVLWDLLCDDELREVAYDFTAGGAFGPKGVPGMYLQLEKTYDWR